MPEGTTGYLFGIFDLFHLDHLDAIRLAAASCDYLVVAVADDDLVESITGKRPFVPANERMEIVGAVGAVTAVQALSTLDLPAQADRAGADVVFVPRDELDAVQLVTLERTWTVPPLVHLPTGRRTASTQVRAALAGSTAHRSVA